MLACSPERVTVVVVPSHTVSVPARVTASAKVSLRLTIVSMRPYVTSDKAGRVIVAVAVGVTR